MPFFWRVVQVLKRQSVIRQAVFPNIGNGSVAKPVRVAVLVLIVDITAFSAAIATTPAGATGSPDAGVANERIAGAIHFLGNDYGLSGGLTIKEKTHPGCGAAPRGLIPEFPELSPAPGVKGDRLAASVCELVAPTDQNR